MREAIRKKVIFALMEPEPQFWVTELGDKCKHQDSRRNSRDDLEKVYSILLKMLKNARDVVIEIPFPQRVITYQGKA